VIFIDRADITNAEGVPTEPAVWSILPRR